VKTDTRPAAEISRWLRGLRDPDVREECRDEFEEWFSEEEIDEEQWHATLRLWRSVIGAARRG
jgi:ferric-dicitrate binding protein FerR (iron transport regulator)